MKRFPNDPWTRSVLLVAVIAASGCSTTMQPITTPPPSPDEDAYTVEAQATDLVVFWQVDGVGKVPLGDRIISRTRQGVQRGLMEGGLRVVDDHGDVRVTFTTEADEFDRSGNYYVYAGRASGDVRLRPVGGSQPDLVGRLDTQIHGERKLGENEALAAVADALSTALGEQALDHAATVRARIRAEAISVRLSWLRRRTRSDRALAEYVTRFVSMVGNLPGVLDCRLLEQDTSAGTAQFRVVYLNDAFPQGINNALLMQPELKLKNIR